MSEHDEQLSLIPDATRERMSVATEIEQTRKCKSQRHAIQMCFIASGLEAKQVYGPLGMEQATFSKIINQKAFLDPDKRGHFMELCGNHIPLRYEAMTEGFDLVPIKTDVEQELAEAKAENQHLKAVLKMMAGQA